MLNVKDDFPFFKLNPGICYMDSASTTQKPSRVIKSIERFYSTYNCNSGRASYQLANRLTDQIERTRESIRLFLGAKNLDEIVFTSGATESFNKIAYALAINYLEDGDEILYSPIDHKSFTLPWHKIKEVMKKFDKDIYLVPYNIKDSGAIDIEDLLSKTTNKTKVINVTHVHNVFGTDNDIGEIKKELKGTKTIINVDATQSVGHMDVNIQDIGASILSFSGHKMFAGQGIGVSYISKDIQSLLSPVFIGGGSGATLGEDGIKVTDFTQAYESGTQNYASIISLNKAIEYIQDIGIHEIHRHLTYLTQYLLARLRDIRDIEFEFGPHYWSCAGGLGILSFRVRNLPSSEAGFILSDNGILVRTGEHCISEPSGRDNIRVSMHIYNDSDDIDRLIETIKLMKPVG
jgi:cysteine desulfurase / selenocysteine lyase